VSPRRRSPRRAAPAGSAGLLATFSKNTRQQGQRDEMGVLEGAKQAEKPEKDQNILEGFKRAWQSYREALRANW